MMKINNWSKIGMFVGLLIFVGMFVRYFIIYSDVSQGVLFLFAGASLMAFSWLYDVAKRLEARLLDLEEYLVDKERVDVR